LLSIIPPDLSGNVSTIDLNDEPNPPFLLTHVPVPLNHILISSQNLVIIHAGNKPPLFLNPAHFYRNLKKVPIRMSRKKRRPWGDVKFICYCLSFWYH